MTKIYYAIDLHVKTAEGKKTDVRDHDATNPDKALEELKKIAQEVYPGCKITRVQAWKMYDGKVTSYKMAI